MKTNNQNQRKDSARPEQNRNEISKKRHSSQEGSGDPHGFEQEQQSNTDISYSEQVDVTPPQHHEFPSTGNAKTDFVSRKQGRTTGRMLGHEPGTEGI